MQASESAAFTGGCRFPGQVRGAGRQTLSDCVLRRVANRERAKKIVSGNGLGEMRHALARFNTHSGLTDIGQIRRKHVLASRSHLQDAGQHITASNNTV